MVVEVAANRNKKDRQGSPARAMTKTRRRLVGWMLILVVDAGFVVWGAMAAALPDYLLGPGGRPILPAGYEGFTNQSWSALAATAPMTANYIGVLFRMYGVFNAAFGLMGSAIAITAFRRGDGWAWWALLAGNTIALVSAMTYDRTVNAIGPFEMSEYLGLALVWGALAVTAPFPRCGRTRSTNGLTHSAPGLAANHSSQAEPRLRRLGGAS